MRCMECGINALVWVNYGVQDPKPSHSLETCDPLLGTLDGSPDHGNNSGW